MYPWQAKAVLDAHNEAVAHRNAQATGGSGLPGPATSGRAEPTNRRDHIEQVRSQGSALIAARRRSLAETGRDITDASEDPVAALRRLNLR